MAVQSSVEATRTESRGLRTTQGVDSLLVVTVALIHFLTHSNGAANAQGIPCQPQRHVSGSGPREEEGRDSWLHWGSSSTDLVAAA